MKCYKMILILSMVVVFWGCGSDTPSTEKQTTKTATAEVDISSMTDEEQIAYMLTEMMDRVKEGDKTVLWEMELQYLTDSINFDIYMQHPRVLNYKYDTLSGITVDTVIFDVDPKIATAGVTVHYESLGGGKSDQKYPLKVYKYKGRWIKPYLGSWTREVEYQSELKSYYESIGDEYPGY